MIRNNSRFTWIRNHAAILVMGLMLFGSFLLTSAAYAQVAYPTFSIVSVTANESVTIQAINLPPNTDFAFKMGAFGTQGLSGDIIVVQNSGDGGTQEFTVEIPEAVQGLSAIAIRMDNFYLGYFAYNWFYNSSTGSAPADPATPAPATPTPAPADPATPAPPVYTGFPTFSVTAVQRNETVTIMTNNFPANTEFTIRMHYMGTQGIGGQVIETIDSEEGGVQVLTFEIPATYANQAQIAIRMENAASGLYAFNWFYNYTATVN